VSANVLYMEADDKAARSPEAPPPTEPAFADLLRSNLDRLYGYCLRLCGDPHDAEDLVQETLLRAVRGQADLRDATRLKPWLFSIATNCWRDAGRARGREVATTPLSEADEDDSFSLFQTIAIEDPFPYSDELHLDFLRVFRDEDVQAVFARMTPAFRLPIILTVVHGFACKEAAAILDIPLGTMLSRLHRGRKQLERGMWEYAVRNGLVTTAAEDEP
jgi:RNA polymerase sigma-70 factor (ECF subfamily)